MQVTRDVGISGEGAWFLMQRLRKTAETGHGLFSGPVEVDETYMGGKRANMSNAKRKALADTGRGAVGKVAVVGAKDREAPDLRGVDRAEWTAERGAVSVI